MDDPGSETGRSLLRGSNVGEGSPSSVSTAKSVTGVARSDDNDGDRDDAVLSGYVNRVALAGVVGQALRSPVFSWCSTLRAEDAHLLEGCVGVAALLNARWFGG